MAVMIDVQAFRDSLPRAVCAAATELRRRGAVGELELAGGGAQAVVRDGGAAYQPWVGIVDREFIAECECAAGEDWCEHSVAVALVALEADIRWSGSATEPSADRPPIEYATFVTAIERLAPRQLTALVAERASEDRLLATRLLSEAGMLTAPDRASLDWFAQVLSEVAGAVSGRRWGIRDVEIAGQRLVDEVAILCAYPPSTDLLELVEEALLFWDELAGYLIDAYYERSIDPSEISEPLGQAHVELCEQLAIDPDELAERLTELAAQCAHETVAVDGYAELLAGRRIRA